MTENGPDTYDEVNMVKPGFNSGWVQLLGPATRNSQERTQNAFRLKVAQAEIFRVQGILRPW
jgi:hypothetical protein